MSTIAIVRTHIDGEPDRLFVTEAETARHWTVDGRSAMPSGGSNAWAAVPPAGSDWETADWDALAHRVGIA